jgi:hypothetical protein
MGIIDGTTINGSCCHFFWISVAKLAGEVTGMMGIMVIYYNFSRYL